MMWLVLPCAALQCNAQLALPPVIPRRATVAGSGLCAPLPCPWEARRRARRPGAATGAVDRPAARPAALLDCIVGWRAGLCTARGEGVGVWRELTAERAVCMRRGDAW